MGIHLFSGLTYSYYSANIVVTMTETFYNWNYKIIHYKYNIVIDFGIYKIIHFRNYQYGISNVFNI